MSDSEEARARTIQNDAVLDPSVGAAIQSAVSQSMGSLTDNLTKVIESRLSDFAKRFSEENSSSVEQAVKRARREQYTCKRKGNQQQLDHSLQVLDKLDEASDALKQKSYDKVKVALESSTELVSKRVKAIKLADKSEFGWATVNEYLSDDETRIYRAERRAERKINKEKRRRVRSDEKGSSTSSTSRAASSSRFSSKDLAFRSESRPARRLGPCFKISSLLFPVILALFFTSSIMALHTSHKPIFSMNCCFALCRSID